MPSSATVDVGSIFSGFPLGFSFSVALKLTECGPQNKVRFQDFRIELYRLLQRVDCFARFTRRVETESDEVV
jgi:hypothetical protein